MEHKRTLALASFPVAASVFSVLAAGLSDSRGAGTAVQANPDANGNYHVGDGVSAPKILYAPEPEMTAEARRRHIKRTVFVLVVVADNGILRDVHVDRTTGGDLSPEDKHVATGLNEDAIKCVKQYRFEPARFHGKAVPVQIEIKVPYGE